MKHSKLALISGIMGLTTIQAAGLNLFSGYNYQPAKTPESPETVAKLREKALDKAIRKGWKHQIGKFSKV